MSGKGSPPLERQPKNPARRKRPASFGVVSRAPDQRIRRALVWASSIAVHVMVVIALFWSRTAPLPAEPSPIQVSLVTLPQQPPGPADAAKTGGAAGAGQPTPQPAASRTAQPAPHAVPSAPRPVPMPAAAKTPTPDSATPAPDDNSDLLSDSQLAGAASAGGEGAGGGGSGGTGGGGGCDTARAVQQALRRDPLVHIAVEDAHRLGKSVMLWNGDWVRSGAQDGKGLSAVREAIIWEVAFSPAACRNARIHGLVLLSLADGATRFAIGAGDWRWSDLLVAH
jgi:hypothetical protein